jgi:hypothetical protein
VVHNPGRHLSTSRCTQYLGFLFIVDERIGDFASTDVKSVSQDSAPHSAAPEVDESPGLWCQLMQALRLPF